MTAEQMLSYIEGHAGIVQLYESFRQSFLDNGWTQHHAEGAARDIMRHIQSLTN